MNVDVGNHILLVQILSVLRCDTEIILLPVLSLDVNFLAVPVGVVVVVHDLGPDLAADEHHSNAQSLALLYGDLARVA